VDDEKRAEFTCRIRFERGQAFRAKRIEPHLPTSYSIYFISKYFGRERHKVNHLSVSSNFHAVTFGYDGYRREKRGPLSSLVVSGDDHRSTRP
jgi:hypothetical protein